MRRALLFAEDYGHRVVVEALVRRLAREQGVPLRIDVRSATRGHGAVVHELRTFLRDLRCGAGPVPDALVIATDANCKGIQSRRRSLDEETRGRGIRVVHAIPDPHVERWLLLDAHAFKTVFGKGCKAPDQKCEKNRYKELLVRAIRDAGGSPLLGGLEFADDLVSAMDLDRLEQSEPSLRVFLQELRTCLNSMQE